MRQSLRAFTGAPGFSATVVLALGLSIGLNSALFTVDWEVEGLPLPR